MPSMHAEYSQPSLGLNFGVWKNVTAACLVRGAQAVPSGRHAKGRKDPQQLTNQMPGSDGAATSARRPSIVESRFDPHPPHNASLVSPTGPFEYDLCPKKRASGPLICGLRAHKQSGPETGFPQIRSSQSSSHLLCDKPSSDAVVSRPLTWRITFTGSVLVKHGLTWATLFLWWVWV